MKKFIDRMESAQGAGESGSPGPGPSGSSSGGDKSGSGKKKWGLGGMVRRVTGSGGPEKDKDVKKDKEGSDGSVDEQPTGLQVDFYLVIVRYPSAEVPQIHRLFFQS
jgi:ubiquitin-like-conjugating enzyme ATG3